MMTNFQKLRAHLYTIRIHRKYVRQVCWNLGLFWQGLTHDLSKYSITELKIYKWYTGTRSPHAAARDELGYSPSWNHHYHRNKHHWQYFVDWEGYPGPIMPIKMPFKYVVEMFADFVGAGRAYTKTSWTCKAPLEYWKKACEGQRLMFSDSEYLIKLMIYRLAESDGDDLTKFYQWWKANKKVIKADYEAGNIVKWRLV